LRKLSRADSFPPVLPGGLFRLWMSLGEKAWGRGERSIAPPERGAIAVSPSLRRKKTGSGRVSSCNFQGRTLYEGPVPERNVQKWEAHKRKASRTLSLWESELYAHNKGPRKGNLLSDRTLPCAFRMQQLCARIVSVLGRKTQHTEHGRERACGPRKKRKVF